MKKNLYKTPYTEHTIIDFAELMQTGGGFSGKGSVGTKDPLDPPE